MHNQLCHHVLFWLNNPESAADVDSFRNAARTLKDIPEVKGFHLGQPAPVAPRPVLDDSYTFSMVLFFNDVAGHDAYQVHPVHQKFFLENKHLWSKVQVYDSI
jgi:hypothetical protein